MPSRKVDWNGLTKRLVTLREEAGLTQGEMARAIGITPVYYGDWERGKPHPGVLDIVLSLADYHHVSTAWLMGQTSLRSIPDAPFVLSKEAEKLISIADSLPLNLRRSLLVLTEELAAMVDAQKAALQGIEAEISQKNEEIVDLLYQLICTTGNNDAIREAERLLGVYHQAAAHAATARSTAITSTVGMGGESAVTL